MTRKNLLSKQSYHLERLRDEVRTALRKLYKYGLHYFSDWHENGDKTTMISRIYIIYFLFWGKL